MHPSFGDLPKEGCLLSESGISVVFRLDHEVALRMRAHRADFRRFLAHNDMAAVRAFPNHVAVLGEHKVIFSTFASRRR